MAIRRQESRTTSATNMAGQAASEAVYTVEEDALTFKNFVKKFYNDWSFHLAQALAYSLIAAIVPIAILLLALVGWFLSGMDPHAYALLIQHVSKALPKEMASQQALTTAANKLRSASLGLTVLAVVAAIFFGSRLFTLLEACFDLIYHVRPRPQGKKNLVAIIMILVSVILIPVLTLASLIPQQAIAFLQNTSLNASPNTLYTVGGIFSSLIVSFLLFEVMYVFVPNKHEDLARRIGTSWKGAVTAAVVLQICLILFPLYTSRFLSGYVGQLAFVLVLLIFFYLMAVSLLIGAQVNAFFAERVSPPATDLITRASRT
jgi:YihY family inner membrane protein